MYVIFIFYFLIYIENIEIFWRGITTNYFASIFEYINF
jgi:hypothetical protein